MSTLEQRIRHLLGCLDLLKPVEIKQRLKSILMEIDHDNQADIIRRLTDKAIEQCVDDFLFNSRENDELTTEDLKLAMQLKSIRLSDIVQLFSNYLKVKTEGWL